MAKIDDLLATGEDALGNHYQITLPEIDQLGGIESTLILRIKSINIPERGLDTYTITKAGKTADRPNGISSQSHDYDVTFMGDKSWHCYNGISNWIKFVQDNESMAMASDAGEDGMGGESTFRHDIQVDAINNLTENYEATNSWVLKGSYPKTISSVEFSEDNGEPLEFTVSFTCLDIKYPTNE